MSEVPEETVELAIRGLRCANCASRVERDLNAIDGVQAVVNFAAERAYVRYDAARVTVPGLIASVTTSGYSATRRQRVRRPCAAICACSGGHWP